MYLKTNVKQHFILSQKTQNTTLSSLPHTTFKEFISFKLWDLDTTYFINRETVSIYI